MIKATDKLELGKHYFMKDGRVITPIDIPKDGESVHSRYCVTSLIEEDVYDEDGDIIDTKVTKDFHLTAHDIFNGLDREEMKIRERF